MGRILHGKFRREANKILEKYLNLFTTDYKKNVKILEVVAEDSIKKIKKYVGWIYNKAN